MRVLVAKDVQQVTPSIQFQASSEVGLNSIKRQIMPIGAVELERMGKKLSVGGTKW